MPKEFKFYFLKLSLIMIFVYILQVVVVGFTDWFVLNGKAVYEYQYWRFVTAIFLHGDIMHLISNLFALLFFGVILEKLIGSKRFLIVFFSSGIIANIIAINFYDSSLGASGAIYGVIGTATIIKPFMMIFAFGLIMPFFIGAILWIIADILRGLGVFGSTEVGSIAHLSGIAIGFILGLLFRNLKRKRNTFSSDKIQIPDFQLRNWEEKYVR